MFWCVANMRVIGSLSRFGVDSRFEGACDVRIPCPLLINAAQILAHVPLQYLRDLIPGAKGFRGLAIVRVSIALHTRCIGYLQYGA